MKQLKKNISIYIIFTLVAISPVWSLSIKGYTNGQKITRCKNDGRIFEAVTHSSYSNYNWYFSSTSNTPVATTSSISSKLIDQSTLSYVLLILTADSAGFTMQTTLEVYSANEPPRPILGKDTTFCQGDSIVLKNYGPTSSSLGYSWNNNPAYGNSDMLKVGSSGVYFLTAENALKCKSSDTIIVKVILNSALLPATKDLCTGEELVLKSLNIIEPIHQILWSTGEKTPTITINSGGKYTLSVKTGAPANCNFTSTTEVFLRDKPEVKLGDDTLVCSGDGLILSNKSTKLVNSQSNRIWNGDPSKNTLSYAADSSGVYSLKLVTIYGCTASDEIKVSAFDPNFTLGVDTSMCTGETLVLTPNPTLPEGSKYQWNGANGESELNVTESGKYWLKASHPDLPMCFSSDTIHVTYFIAPEIALGDDIEDSLEVTINASMEGKYSEDDFEFEWTNIDNQEVVGKTPEFVFSETISLALVVKNKLYRCEGIDSIKFTKTLPIEPKTVFAPNVFSPSATIEQNRVFKVMGSAIDESSFQVSVFDRWGNLLFHSTDFKEMKSNGWDGKLKSGKTIASGTYTYVVKSKYVDGEDISLNGSVTFVP